MTISPKAGETPEFKTLMGPYWQGVCDALAGKRLSDCPYERSTAQHISWVSGYSHAHAALHS